MRKFARTDYMLSFSVQGVSVFVTDIHRDAYKRLEALFIIDHGLFKQYFTKVAYDRAVIEGLEFYRSKTSFEDYGRGMVDLCTKFERFYGDEIRGRDLLPVSIVQQFFEYTRRLCGDYTKMNFEFTDGAYQHKNQDPTIQENLAEVAKLKDRVRVVMNTVLFEPDGYTATAFRILGEQFGVPADVIEQLTQVEILALYGDEKPDIGRVRRRQMAFVESCDDEGWLEGVGALPVLKEFREIASGGDVIRGQVASVGRVSGVVRVIPVDYGDSERVMAAMDAMLPGEVLVAETTAPELMAACRKAAAIVTDVGGLLSHAAIVSREFGIPCIVGTQIASKSLQNGDLVEVDAETGLVKVLQRRL